MSQSTKPKLGRPRSEVARIAILDAAYRLLIDRGLGRLTIEAVAAEAGVGKPTIYRYWANAQELAMAALIARTDFRKSGTKIVPLVDALQAHMADVVKVFSTNRGRQIITTMASADAESELAKAFRGQIIEGSRKIGREILTSLLAQKTVKQDINLEHYLDMLYGPLFYRLLTNKMTDKDYSERAVTLLVRLIKADK
jgi:AcrR family transcriptional regulator